MLVLDSHTINQFNVSKKIEGRIQSINHVTDWAPMPIELAGSMSENLKKDVSMGKESIPGQMDVLTVENSKTSIVLQSET